MQTNRHRLHFNGEGLPQIGSGVRTVDVKVGRKLVHMKEVAGTDKGWKKFRMSIVKDSWPEVLE